MQTQSNDLKLSLTEVFMAPRLRAYAVLAVAAAVLLAVGAPPALLTDPGGASRLASPDDAIAMTAATAAWLLVAWLLFAGLAALLAALPGRVGRVCGTCCAVITP